MHVARLHAAPARAPQACRRSAARSTLARVASEVRERSQSVSGSSSSVISLFFNPSGSWGSAAVVHGSLAGGAWQDIPLSKVHSSGGKWWHAKVPVPSLGATMGSKPLLEFVVTDKQGNWAKPSAGGNFEVASPGNVAVAQGVVRPVSGRRVMVVSDLDGTMVGDDSATKAFRSFWEESAVPRGGVLVYNTGRALDSFLKLKTEKAGCLAHPDVLILAVGTKICTRDSKGGWQEDAGWVSQLSEGWDLGVARDTAYKALSKVGQDSMHFRPPEEQNDHKVTCGVAASALPQVQAILQEGFAARGLTPNIIVSGHGDWRFVDVVPIRAGKLEALKYVAQSHGFGLHEVVACGDSGNDILMLQGENPAIVVGNAQPDLRTWYEKQRGAESSNGGPNGLPRLLMTRKHEALGILEGLEAWGFK